MKVSFDGARRNLANSFNKLAKTELSEEQIIYMEDLRSCIGGFLCMYADNDEDCHDLSDVVRLTDLGDDDEN